MGLGGLTGEAGPSMQQDGDLSTSSPRRECRALALKPPGKVTVFFLHAPFNSHAFSRNLPAIPNTVGPH